MFVSTHFLCVSHAFNHNNCPGGEKNNNNNSGIKNISNGIKMQHLKRVFFYAAKGINPAQT